MLFTSELKVAIITQGYAFLLCVTNWRFEKTYDRGVGLQLSAIDLRFMGAGNRFCLVDYLLSPHLDSSPSSAGKWNPGFRNKQEFGGDLDLFYCCFRCSLGSAILVVS